ncbi:hypothetical protein NEDG_01085 [Nematocida displodere]|uniref:Nuclear pore protein n=1 Tax=Nematocida displodere TaxID=1805483 RepID=A0A177EB45_9MICR|nr:hypothetical protein NEDG_01085 [Nematocida displodere]
MELLRILTEDEFPVKTYSMAGIEIELSLKNTAQEIHNYHPELDKKIKETGRIVRKVEETGTFTVDGLLDGIFQKKMIEYGEQLARASIEEFDRKLKEKFVKKEKFILSAPKPKEFKIRKEDFAEMIVNGCVDLTRGKTVSENNFSSAMLYESYEFALSSKTPIDFLTEMHLKHVIRDRSPESVNKHVQERYHRGMFKIDVYNSRFVFIELYYYIRSGMYREAEEFVEQNEGFFKEVSRNFSVSLFKWLGSLGFSAKQPRHETCWEEAPGPNDDPFKIFFFNIFTADPNPVKEVILTIEDFLWYQLIINKTIEASFPQKKKMPSEEIFSMLSGVITSSRLLQAALVLQQWRSAIDILHDDSFKTGEVLFLAYAVAKKIKEENLQEFPVKRGTAATKTTECINLFVRMVQGVSSLFLRPAERLNVIQIVAPFVMNDWTEDLAAEVFISSENFTVLGCIDEKGRKTASTLREYIEVSSSAVIQRISEYYVHSGELDKALKVSYLGSTKKTLGILTQILVEKIKKKDFGTQGLESLVKHLNNAMLDILWTIILVGGATGNICALIRRTGLIPTAEAASVLKKAQDIAMLSPEIRAVIPSALVIVAKRLGECVSDEHKELGKSLLLLAGVLEVDKTIIQEIVSEISPLL